MYERIDGNDGNFIAFKLTGEITEEDIREMSRIVDDACAKSDKIRMFFKLTELQVDDASAYWETFKIARNYAQDVERVAIVGDENWEKRWIGIGGKLVETEVQYFDEERLEDAWDWIQE